MSGSWWTLVVILVCLNWTVALHYFGYSLERDAEVGTEYKQVIDSSVQYIWRYSFDRRNKSAVQGDTFVIHTSVDQTSSTHSPVIFEVRYLHQTTDWSLPIRSGSGRIYKTTSRTLCSDPPLSALYNPLEYEYYDDLTTVQVTVSTRSRLQVTFTMAIAWQNNTIRNLEQPVTTQFSPSSPAQFRLAVPSVQLPSRYVLLYITSPDNICSTVTVQHAYCSSTPAEVADDPSSLPVKRLISQHKMTRKSAVNIKREDLYKGTLLLTFTMHEDPTLCGLSTDNHKIHPHISINTSLTMPLVTSHPPYKLVEFKLLEKINDETYLFATSGTFLCLLIFCVSFAVLFWKRFRMAYVTFYLSQKEQEQEQQQYQNHPCTENPCRTQQPVSIAILPTTSNTISSTEKIDIQDEDLCCMFFLVANAYSTGPTPSKKRKYLQDNCKKCARDITKSTKRYVSTLAVVAAFYILPVLQFVLLYQQVLNDTGNEDLCYYNFMCLHPLGSLTTFNHMFSNIGYVMLGLLFIMIVHVEQKRRYEGEPTGESEIGIHSHFGIFYAMGIALAMEGLMSAFYHICPNRLNYQFDMCFMYVTTLLCLVKLYQGRHPDSNASALMAYGSLAMVVLLVAAGVLFQTWYFWSVITLIHFGVVFVMSLHLYSLGDWRISWPKALNKPENLSYVFSSIFHPFSRRVGWLTIFLVFVNFANWFTAGLGYVLFYKIHDVASHLVFVLLINLLLYSLIYLFLKLRHGEKILWPTWMYVWLSIPFWFVGLYLFIFERVDGWHLSQAESRNLNDDCVLWEFYDWHDIWHFLSAFGIFFMFMFFFTLDDDLRNVKRTSIKVF